METRSMPQEKLLSGFFDAMNRRDLEKMGTLFAEKTVFYFPKTKPLLGKERILKFFKILFRQFPELNFDIRRIIVQENQAAIHWTNKGQNRKGEPYENEGVTLLEMDGSKVLFISDFFKDTEKF
jgi:uncharacterized protein (TIGR02246 family)